ncbi:MAG: hypothetical protein WAO08_14220, partial [Hyphomicrobiaceae bacterium]
SDQPQKRPTGLASSALAQATRAAAHQQHFIDSANGPKRWSIDGVSIEYRSAIDRANGPRAVPLSCAAGQAQPREVRHLRQRGQSS